MARWLPLLVALAALELLSQALSESRATVRAEDNLLRNGGFEQGVEGWSVSVPEATLVQDGEHARSGSYRVAFTHNKLTAFFFHTGALLRIAAQSHKASSRQYPVSRR